MTLHEKLSELGPTRAARAMCVDVSTVCRLIGRSRRPSLTMMAKALDVWPDLDLHGTVREYRSLAAA